MIRPLLAALALAALPGCGAPPDEPPPSDTCSLAPPDLPDTHLHARGARLEDALGRAVVLRGVNAGGRSKFAPFAPFDFDENGYQAALDDYLDRAAEWGIDVLRVPFVWSAVEPTQGAYDEAFLKRYDAILDGAWARGMFTIVDFHQDVYADVYCGDGFPAWTLPDPHPAPHHDCPHWGGAYLSNPDVAAAFDRFWADGSPVRAAFLDLWDRMAARHRDRPGVIGFEPINEPGWGTADPDTWEATTLTDFYSEMASRLRAAAPDALVLFDATGIDAVTVSTHLGRPAGEGLVFAPHYYQNSALAGQAGNAAAVPVDLGRWAKRGEPWDVPVLLGEFGASNAAPDAGDYLAAHYDALDALGMHGTQWEYSTAAELWNFEDLSVAGPDGAERPVGAAIARPYPRAVAGSEIAFSYDRSTGDAEIHYVPAEGITEMVVPARAYAHGYDVEVTGACADTSHPGRLLVRAEPGASEVRVRVTAR